MDPFQVDLIGGPSAAGARGTEEGGGVSNGVRKPTPLRTGSEVEAEEEEEEEEINRLPWLG
jgi:hypothetical protein